jgi:hypothetical protein
MPAGKMPMAAGPQTLSGGAAIMPPGSSSAQEGLAVPSTPPELDAAIQSAAELIRTSSATTLSDLIDIQGAKLACFKCNCTYDYTFQMPLGDVVYSINFLLSFVQSVSVSESTVQVRCRDNGIVVTADRKLQAMSVRDVRTYDSFEIYLEDREAAEKVAQHLSKARDLCTK